MAKSVRSNMVFMISLGILSLSTIIAYPHENWVTETTFSETEYYDLFEAFWTGMQFESKYDNGEQCRLSMSSYFDSFYTFHATHIGDTSGDQEARFFTLTQIVAGPFADSLYHCFLFM